MLKRFAVLMVASFCIIGLLAACGGSSDDNGGSSDSGDSGSNTVSIVMSDDMKFTPNTFTVKPGEKVTVKLENKGSLLHDFSIDDPKVQKDVAAGKTDTVTFTAPDSAGTLDFYCDQPGHKAAGMTGTITVQ